MQKVCHIAFIYGYSCFKKNRNKLYYLHSFLFKKRVQSMYFRSKGGIFHVYVRFFIAISYISR